MATLLLSLVSCGGPKSLPPNYAPEESGLNVMKITDESSNAVAGNQSFNTSFINNPATGLCKNANFSWSTVRLLDISPDGNELAYESLINNQWNIMIRKAGPQGSATQRTFRSVGDFSWGNDGNLYFGDAAEHNRCRISVTNAHIGTLMRQITSSSNDCNPVLSKDGKVLYFTRIDMSGAFVWSYDLVTGALTSCCQGYNPYPVGDDNDTFLCVRNSGFGTSELWLVNYQKGQETLILSDKNRGFTNPVVSPDGQWILCQGNSKSSISKKNNLDIFAVKIDGTGFVQLTYHPSDDCCPVWAADGKSIYFISSRASAHNAFNIWKMRFDL